MLSMKRLGQILTDVVMLTLAFLLAYILRIDFPLPVQALKYTVFQLPYVVALEYVAILAFGAHRVVWRFVSASDVLTLLRPLLLASMMLIVVRLVAPQLPFDRRAYLTIPGGVIVINLLLASVGILGTRISRRLLAERKDRQNIERPGRKRKMVLVGAGKSGVQVAQEVARRPDLGLDLIGFVDDDPAKLGTSICGHRVLAKVSDLKHIVATNEVDDVVIAITEISKELVREIVSTCKSLSASVKIVPGLYEIIAGQVNISRLRDVSIEDVLGRDAVELDKEKIGDFIKGRVIAVTGAGGSIGSELARQVASFGPKRLLLLERTENALFEIHRELSLSFPDLELVPVIADVTLKERLRSIFTQYPCSAIIHAAAHKHVPMMEWNPSEAIRNNTLGTKCIADLAAELEIERFVLISTDKAINPTSIMGASKRAAELYLQAMSNTAPRTKFISVRFGNVLGSAGSVVPIFKKQIAEGGPVKVTHPEMVRYFMTIPEAAQLVLQAATLGDGGEVFILDMGEPVKIVDLAKDLIRLSGLRPEEDVEIVFTGMRPGEKLFEELSTSEEKADRTSHLKIFVGRVKEVSSSEIDQAMGEFATALTSSSPQDIYESLRKLVPEFTGNYKN